jgi:hypothetical protein
MEPVQANRADVLLTSPTIRRGATAASSSIRGPAAVHRQGLSIDKAAPLPICQKKNRLGNIVRCRKPSHRIYALNIGIGVRATGLVRHIHLRLHPSRADRIRTHAATAPFRCQRPRQSQQDLSELALNLCERDGLDAILLAGTDLSRIFNPANIQFPCIDCAALHIEAILQRVLA